MNAAGQGIISLGDEARLAPNGIVNRTPLRTTDARVVLFGFAEGQESTEHACMEHALMQILSGECELGLPGKPRTTKAGGLLPMPPNVPLAVKVTSQGSTLLTLSKPETN